MVLIGKKPNSADISDDISDVSSKTIIHCRLEIIGIYSSHRLGRFDTYMETTFLSDCKQSHVTVTVRPAEVACLSQPSIWSITANPCHVQRLRRRRRRAHPPMSNTASYDQSGMSR